MLKSDLKLTIILLQRNSGSELSLKNSFAFFGGKFHIEIHILGPPFFEHHKKECGISNYFAKAFRT